MGIWINQNKVFQLFGRKKWEGKEIDWVKIIPIETNLCEMGRREMVRLFYEFYKQSCRKFKNKYSRRTSGVSFQICYLMKISNTYIFQKNATLSDEDQVN